MGKGLSRAQRRRPGGVPTRRAEGEFPPRCLSPDDSLQPISGSRQSGPIETSGRVRGGPPNASRWLGRPAESAERGQARANPLARLPRVRAWLAALVIVATLY